MPCRYPPPIPPPPMVDLEFPDPGRPTLEFPVPNPEFVVHESMLDGLRCPILSPRSPDATHAEPPPSHPAVPPIHPRFPPRSLENQQVKNDDP